MNKKLEKKIVLNGAFEVIIKENNHLYVVHKLDKICVLPYIISTEGILDKIGVIKELNILKEKNNYTLINGYISQDDPTNLVTANKILYEIIGSNVTNADDWEYLGIISNVLIGGNVIIYGVNISNININQSEEIEKVKKIKGFELLPANKVVSSDDALFLASYMRLFNHFYVNSLQQ